jgi:hypothetical protein
MGQTATTAPSWRTSTASTRSAVSVRDRLAADRARPEGAGHQRVVRRRRYTASLNNTVAAVLGRHCATHQRAVVAAHPHQVIGEGQSASSCHSPMACRWSTACQAAD